ncbi:hypothetical protein BFJ63_vAg20243 [Fusarium oxysporum f. sp. narcissi]|uniref:Uncharacterized protein n=1 Tax=Fusarium oxysporum f. sp. narcissi TaxID=451672 RepID=A0A4Q2USG0_FUSOX|nr:hypothetical protein BFJ63_vAg20243 [Fusarium oxysporum f. sp. narcissi]
MEMTVEGVVVSKTNPILPALQNQLTQRFCPEMIASLNHNRYQTVSGPFRWY